MENVYKRHRLYWRLQRNKRSLDNVVGIETSLRAGLSGIEIPAAERGFSVQGPTQSPIHWV